MRIYCGYNQGLNWEYIQYTDEAIAREFIVSLRHNPRRASFIVVEGSWGMFEFVKEIWYAVDVVWKKEGLVFEGSKQSTHHRLLRYWKKLLPLMQRLQYPINEEKSKDPSNNYYPKKET